MRGGVLVRCLRELGAGEPIWLLPDGELHVVEVAVPEVLTVVVASRAALTPLGVLDRVADPRTGRMLRGGARRGS